MKINEKLMKISRENPQRFREIRANIYGQFMLAGQELAKETRQRYLLNELAFNFSELHNPFRRIGDRVLDYGDDALYKVHTQLNEIIPPEHKPGLSSFGVVREWIKGVSAYSVGMPFFGVGCILGVVADYYLLGTTDSTRLLAVSANNAHSLDTGETGTITRTSFDAKRLRMREKKLTIDSFL